MSACDLDAGDRSTWPPTHTATGASAYRVSPSAWRKDTLQIVVTATVQSQKQEEGHCSHLCDMHLCMEISQAPACFSGERG